ncbi:hypothetical protein T492DRAFT_857131, partial [Pavlovales sp. CCMP2436]
GGGEAHAEETPAVAGALQPQRSSVEPCQPQLLCTALPGQRRREAAWRLRQGSSSSIDTIFQRDFNGARNIRRRALHIRG